MNQDESISIEDARPTKFRGIQYRSRMEARWAAFFEALSLEVEYEATSFDFGDGRVYLPDFYIPTLGCWVEIKGAEPNERAQEKALWLAQGTGQMVYIFSGGARLMEMNSGAKSLAVFPDGALRPGYKWIECSRSGKFSIAYLGLCDNPLCLVMEGREYAARTPRLQAAYLHARQVRFADPLELGFPA